MTRTILLYSLLSLSVFLNGCKLEFQSRMMRNLPAPNSNREIAPARMEMATHLP